MVDPIELPAKIVPIIFGQGRYKVLRGGRGSGKSWSFARALICRAARERLRILCTREMQNSIKDSVYRLLLDQIADLHYEKFFIIQKDGIRSIAGSEFLFKGLHHNISEIKSTEGIDLCWVEEAERVSEDSWTVLIPTIRKEKSEIWISFNPELENSATYTRFVKTPPPDFLSAAVTFEDNYWFPEVLRKEMEYDKKVDYEKYEHVWLGKPKKYAHALIFKGKFRVEEFETPEDTQFYLGADFGFASDPTILIRCWIKDNKLYIDYEAFGHGVEINELPTLFDKIPDVRIWKIYGDSARPETCSYLRNQGFCIEPVKKWQGSVEEGIQFIRSFEEVVIHTRCPHTYSDFNNYKWKTDKITNEVLPIPADGSDHAPDACRYALEPYIKNKVSCFDVL